MSPRWLITGGRGQLATHVASLLGADAVCLTRRELDITSAPAVERAIASHRPSVVLNAAGYTAVDASEADEGAARRVNALGPRLLAEALARHGGRLIHMSTDYVFDGDATRPYEVGDRVGPRTAYGRSKLAGELAVRRALPGASHILRTAWVYGGPGPNFLDTMIRLEREQPTLDVVNDQVGSPTWVRDLAAAVVALGSSPAPAGTLHYTGSGRATWFEFAVAIFAAIGADVSRVRPISSAVLARPARRPAWSVLSSASWEGAGLAAPRPWQQALADAVETRTSRLSAARR